MVVTFLLLVTVVAAAPFEPKPHLNATNSNGCQNGAQPYTIDGKPLVLPAGPQKGQVVCNCPAAPGYHVDPNYGPSLTGLDCENNCNMDCMNQCMGCMGNTVVFEGDSMSYDSSWNCAEYCGGGADYFSYTDTCCYHVCGCDKSHQATPKAVSGCLEATSAMECLGSDLGYKCRAPTISMPGKNNCPPGYSCNFVSSDGIGAIGTCEKDSDVPCLNSTAIVLTSIPLFPCCCLTCSMCRCPKALDVCTLPTMGKFCPTRPHKLHALSPQDMASPRRKSSIRMLANFSHTLCRTHQPCRTAIAPACGR